MCRLYYDDTRLAWSSDHDIQSDQGLRVALKVANLQLYKDLLYQEQIYSLRLADTIREVATILKRLSKLIPAGKDCYISQLLRQGKAKFLRI